MPKVMLLNDQAGNPSGWLIHCPACGYGHFFDKRWTFNGNLERPTFRASMLVYEHADRPRCHSFVTNGRIEYLKDCTHAQAGETVDLPDTSTW